MNAHTSFPVPDTNHHVAGSAEPMHRPDHKAKKHSKPRWPGFPGARKNESIGGGYFIFKRGDRTGRIETSARRFAGGIPFEHSTFIAAQAEACRLQKKYGGVFEVYGSLTISPDMDAEWDFDPHGEGCVLESVA